MMKTMDCTSLRSVAVLVVGLIPPARRHRRSLEEVGFDLVSLPRMLFDVRGVFGCRCQSELLTQVFRELSGVRQEVDQFIS